MEGTKYEIWTGDFIREVSLEELAQMTMAHDIEVVWYVEKENKKMLINFLVTATARILENGTHVVKRAITEAVFTKVDKYERMIVYDHFRKACSYVSDMENIKRYETTYLLPVIRCPSKVVDTVAKAIVKK